MEKICYFDNNATTKTDERVVEKMLPYFSSQYFNPSALYQPSQKVRHAIKDARCFVAELINASENEVFFTSCATESNNLAIKGILAKYSSKGKHIICSSIEHPSVHTPFKYLEISGYETTWVPCDENGIIDVEKLKSSIKSDTVLVSVMHANNETGSIQPVEEIGEICKNSGVIFHVDAVQSAGKIPVDVEAINADSLSLSAHKFYGPKGVGALYIKKGTRILPLFHGGAQEFFKRAGTENTAGIIGFGEAAKLAKSELELKSKRVKTLRDNLEKSIFESTDNIRLNGHKNLRLPNTINISIKGVKSSDLLIALDLKNICASSGSACSSGLPEPSHVLKSMGIPDEYINGTLRFSLGAFTTEEETQYLAKILPSIVKKLRSNN